MARTRLINPEFFLHEGLGRCSPHARLLFIALWTQADREGLLRWLPLRIHGETFPHEPELDVSKLAAELVESGSFVVYEHDGRLFGKVTGFTKWQNPHRNESASRFPPPPDEADYGAAFSALGQPMVNQRETNGRPNTSYVVTSLELPVTSRPPSGVSSDHRRADVAPSLKVPTGDPLLDFLLTTWGTGSLLGRHDTLEKWIAAARGGYPGIDLLAEARRAHAWEEGNPSKRKKRIRPFLSRWWTSAQDRGARSSRSGGNTQDQDAETLEHLRQLGVE